MQFGNRLAHMLQSKGQISTEDESIYGYLFDYIFEEICFILVTLLIGLMLHRMDITLCYLFVSTPLRHFAGGFHANTRLGCTILSYGLFIAIILLCPIVVPFFRLLWFAVYALCWFLIYVLAPVDTPNKRLPPETKVLLRHRCLFTFVLMTIVYLILWHQQQVLYYGSISVCVMVCVAGLLIGAYKNSRTAMESHS